MKRTVSWATATDAGEPDCDVYSCRAVVLTRTAVRAAPMAVTRNTLGTEALGSTLTAAVAAAFQWSMAADLHAGPPTANGRERPLSREVSVSVRTIAFVVAAMVLAAGSQGPADEQGAFKVIVNPSVAGEKIPRDVVAQIYLGKVARWADGRHIVVADLSSTSGVRAAFSSAVLRMPVEEVKNYWLRSASAARRPPTIRASDQEMIAFVAAESGAIGYVSGPAPLPPTVRAVTVE